MHFTLSPSSRRRLELPVCAVFVALDLWHLLSTSETTPQARAGSRKNLHTSEKITSLLDTQNLSEPYAVLGNGRQVALRARQKGRASDSSPDVRPKQWDSRHGRPRLYDHIDSCHLGNAPGGVRIARPRGRHRHSSHAYRTGSAGSSGANARPARASLAPGSRVVALVYTREPRQSTD